MSDSLTGLAGWVLGVIQSLGYVGIAVLIALENLLPPIPSEVILPLAGLLVGQGRFAFLPVLIASTAGSLAGALVLYGLGRWLGEERLRRFVKRYGRFLLLDESDLDRAVGWFDRYGGPAVFFGRLVPGYEASSPYPRVRSACPSGASSPTRLAAAHCGTRCSSVWAGSSANAGRWCASMGKWSSTCCWRP